MTRKNPRSPEFGTLPEVARRYGLGVKVVRRAAKAAAFPVYTAGTTWPRVRFAEFEAWLKSTRVRIGHRAKARASEIIDREKKRRRKTR